MNRLKSALLLLLLVSIAMQPLAADERVHELVIRGGRVIDPETRLDARRDVAIDGGVITAIAEGPLRGAVELDATGKLVVPGFIDLHQHAWDKESLDLKALDGVTTVFELEVGTAEVEQWYAELADGCRLNHGVSIGHIPVRMQVMGDAPAFLPVSEGRASQVAATPEQVDQMAKLIRRGLADGAVAVGFGFAYTPAASDAEIKRMMEVAAEHGASCHVHLRSLSDGGPAMAAIDAERLASSAGAALHIVHLQASAKGAIRDLLGLVNAWQAAGKDVSGEVYPWTAGMTEIQSSIFATGWQQRLGIDYHDMQWGATGERLTEESFRRYREQGGLVIVHSNTEEAVALAVNHPEMMIASDGLKGHPRNAGTYARVLQRYVRDQGSLELMSALRKMSLLPAQRLEGWVPAMRKKGRVQIGCDADLTVFRLQDIEACATYEEPETPSRGVVHVLVMGVPVVRDGQLVSEARPGRGVRAGTN